MVTQVALVEDELAWTDLGVRTLFVMWLDHLEGLEL